METQYMKLMMNVWSKNRIKIQAGGEAANAPLPDRVKIKSRAGKRKEDAHKKGILFEKLISSRIRRHRRRSSREEE